MQQLVGTAIVIGALTIATDFSSAKSINVDWPVVVSPMSDTTRMDVEGTVFIPSYPIPGRRVIADANPF
jgi:hypothetical protein